MSDTGSPKASGLTLPILKEKLSKLDLKNNVQIGIGVVYEGRKFVNSHIKTLEKNKGNRTYLPYWHRLVEYYEAIK